LWGKLRWVALDLCSYYSYDILPFVDEFFRFLITVIILLA
jgi:hypothetical protein